MQRTIESVSENIKARKLGVQQNVETIHIRGIDAITKKEEVIEAIEEKIGSL